jgi:hypothetical protein
LVSAAERTFDAFGLRSGYGDRYGISIDDLVDIGWLVALRRRPETRLRSCYGILLKIMYENVRQVISWQSKYERRRYPVTINRVGDSYDVDLLAQGESDLCALES